MDAKKVFKAAELNEFDKVKKFIEEEGFPAGIIDENALQDRRTLAQIATMNGNLDMLRYLLGKDPSLASKIRSSDTKVDMYSLLEVATEHGALNVVKYLVEEHNANIFEELVGHKYMMVRPTSAIHLAIEKNHLNILKYFIEERHVNVEHPKTVFRFPLLHWAVMMSSSNALIEYLVDKADDLAAVDETGENVLYKAVSRKNLSVIKLILDVRKAKIDINCKLVGGETLVHEAVRRKALDILEYLVEQKNADINAANSEGWAPLHEAANINSLEISKYLLQHGAVIEQRNAYGATPLLITAAHIESHRLDIFYPGQSKKNENDHQQVLKYLIDRGADVNAKTNIGNRALHYVVSNKQNIALEYLIKHGADVNQSNAEGDTPLHRATSKMNDFALKYLIKHGADVNRKNVAGDTPSHRAASVMNIFALKYLIKYGANINERNEEDETVLDIMVYKRDLKTSRYLIEHGADIDSKNKKGETVVHRAAIRNRIEILDYLVRERYANVNVTRTSDNWTLLHCAAYWGHAEVCEYLIEHGADTRARDQSGQIPAQVALDERLKNYLRNGIAKRSRRSVGQNYLLSIQPSGTDKSINRRLIAENFTPSTTFFAGHTHSFQFQNFLALLSNRYLKRSSFVRPPLLSVQSVLQDKMDPIAEDVVNNFEKYTNFLTYNGLST